MLMSLNLFPLRFRCVRLTRRSARTSRPPDILLSLSSNCSHTFQSAPKQTFCVQTRRNHANLFEFVQFGDFGDAAQAHVDEAEQLQVGELCCDALNLAVIGATVVQDQLLHLREAESHTNGCKLSL